MQLFMNITSNSDWNLHTLNIYFSIAGFFFFFIFQSQQGKNDPNHGIGYLNCVSTGGKHVRHPQGLPQILGRSFQGPEVLHYAGVDKSWWNLG